MSWIGALVIVVAVYLVTNIVLRRYGLFSSALSSEALHDLVSRREDRPLLLDVRSSGEYRQGHIPTAVNIPHESIASRPPKTPPDGIIVVYGRNGSHSLGARSSLRRLGFTNVVSFGSVRRWKEGLIAGPDPGAPMDDLSQGAGGHLGPERDGR